MASEGIQAKMDELNVTKPSTSQSAEPTDKPQKKEKERKDKKAGAKAKPAQGPGKGGKGGKKEDQDQDTKGITVTKAEDISEWYQQVILKAEMLEFTDVPGCYIYLPRSYLICCLLYTSPSPRDGLLSRMPSSA